MRKKIKPNKNVAHEARQLVEAIYAGFPHFGEVKLLDTAPDQKFVPLNLNSDNYPQLQEVRAHLEQQGWTLVQRNLSGRFYGQIAALYPDYRLNAVERQITKAVALVSYEQRDQAKQLKFTWSPRDKEWWRNVPTERAAAFTYSLPFKCALTHRVETDYEIIPDEITPALPKPGTVAGALLAGMRRTHGGPPKVLAPCPHCGEPFGTADLRSHKPRCEMNPLVIKRAAKKK